MPSREEIEEQQKLLGAQRQTLSILLEQQAKHTKAFTPPATVHGIREARAEILHIKQVLRGWEVVVEDLPSDIEGDGLALSPEQNDANLLRQHRVIFDRSAFSMSCIAELGLYDLQKAIDNTVAALNTGRLYSRDGNLVGEFRSRNGYLTKKYRQVFDSTLVDLRELRGLAIRFTPIFDQYAQSTASFENFYSIIHRPEISSNLDFAIQLVHRMEEIDKIRNRIVNRLNRLFQGIGENRLPIVKLSSNVVKKARRYDPLYDAIADLL